MKKLLIFTLSVFSFLLIQCTGDTPDESTSEYTFMDGEDADCEFDRLTFSLPSGIIEVSINGLMVEEMNGANKLTADTVETVTRRGVRFSDIFSLAGISLPDETPVNCIARDGYDPLRTKLEGDISKLPTFGFLRDYGYIYVGNPGDKDPLYPEMEGKTLMVDYDIEDEGEIPEYLGGTLASLGIFRWMMVEYMDENQFGIFEMNLESTNED
ncbi:MAG: hypothetical protein JXR95_13800 [Deltaproteobacteria bacterium]|nr:hypothetical protein [Deltaproteobacteria bacterium]